MVAAVGPGRYQQIMQTVLFRRARQTPPRLIGETGLSAVHLPVLQQGRVPVLQEGTPQVQL